MTATLLILAVTFVSVATLVPAEEPKRYDGHKLIRFFPETWDHNELLRSIADGGLELNTWKEANRRGDPVDIQVSPEHLLTLLAQTGSSGIRHQTLLDDVQRHLDDVMIANELAAKSEEYTFTKYHEYPAILEWVEKRASDCGSRCEMFTIGKSYEGRDLKVIKIGTPGNNKLAIWLDAGIHAREWIAPSVAMYTIDRLIADYETDTEVKRLVDTFDWFILPVINPDGYVYTWSSDRMWRKTRSPTAGSSCVGVDANRNFAYKWNTIGASSDPCSNTFAGSEAETEPEVRAMRDFIMARKDQFRISVSLHSHGQLWMAPWGYTTDQPDNYDELMVAGRQATDALKAVHGTEYQVGSASEILYQSSGTSRDWAKGVPQIRYVYTVELRDTGEHGFVLPPEQIQPSGEETWAGIRELAKNYPA